MRLLDGDEVAGLLDAGALVDALQEGLAAFSAGAGSIPPRPIARAPSGVLATMPGYLPPFGLATKVITVFPGNSSAGIPAHQGVVLVFDEANGTPLAMMDAAALTAARTGAATAVAVRLLARRASKVLAIIGSGVQARSHLQAVAGQRDFSEIRLAARNADAARRLAAAEPRVIVVESIGDAAAGADVICLCTDSGEPLLDVDHINEGALVTSVGTGEELGQDLVAAARVFVEWRGAAEHPAPTGAADLQSQDPGSVTELGEVLNGARPGRQADDELLVYKSTGHALEDIVAARLALSLAEERATGSMFEL